MRFRNEKLNGEFNLQIVLLIRLRTGWTCDYMANSLLNSPHNTLEDLELPEILSFGDGLLYRKVSIDNVLSSKFALSGSCG